MRFVRKFELLLLILFLVFSSWLMDKSFGYDAIRHQFRVARHQVGDFGLHLSLIRSFSWGNNWPTESPFFPGKPLPYHYYFDFLVSILERLGLRLDLAFNGLSVIAFTLLLFLLYKLPQLIFGKNKILGILSVILFIFPSSLTFWDFFKERNLSFSLWRDLWFLPDYLNQGPFDGSLISIYFTLNVFLNQRHLIAALAINFGIILVFISYLLKHQKIPSWILIGLGIILGLSSGIHSLIFLSTVVVVFGLLVIFGQYAYLWLFLISVGFAAWPHLRSPLNQKISDIVSGFFHPGFLTPPPITWVNFLKYWIANLGLLIIFVFLGFSWANRQQKKIFLSFLPLFIIANTFKLSFRLEHNHSLLNYFLIMANFYAAFALWRIWEMRKWGRIVAAVSLGLLTLSGVINLMAVKNDFQYPVLDAPASPLMQWIKNNTDKKAIFLARQEIFDPVTLSGRRNYFGATYYLSVMGYDFKGRERLVKTFFEADNRDVLNKIREERINYMIIPVKPVTDFNFQTNIPFLEKNLTKVYQDNEVIVYKL